MRENDRQIDRHRGMERDRETERHIQRQTETGRDGHEEECNYNISFINYENSPEAECSVNVLHPKECT